MEERARLQSILKSGALPTSVTIVQLETLSPTLGTTFIKNALLAGFVALIGVIVVVGTRYKKPRIVLPMIIISSSEILIILGIASMIGWTIDLPAIAGIIATIGSGINSQIMIIDQALRGEDKTLSLREKLKSAFFVIFGAGGTVIAAMIPLMIVGFGLLRGFAITTIIGVLVGIVIARPAFGEIVKRILKE
jgi:preprotein translocase subunit SecD